MATLNEKFLNYDGLLYAFKKIIAYVKSSVGFKTSPFVKSISGYGTGAAPSSTSGVNDTKNKLEGTYTTGKLDGTGTDVTNNKFTYIDTTYGEASATKAGLMGTANYDIVTGLAQTTSGKGASLIGYDATNTAASGTVGGAIKALQDAVGGGDLVKSVDNATSFDPEISKNTEIFTPASGTITSSAKVHGKVVARTGNYTKADNSSGTFTYYDTIYGMANNIGNAAASAGAGLFRWIEINNQHGIRQNGGSDTFSIIEGVQSITLDGGDIMVDVDSSSSAFYNTTIESALTSLKTQVDNIASAGLSYVILGASDNLPTASASVMGTVYLKPETGSSGNNYDEWLCVDKGENADPRYVWEKIGSTEVNLDIAALTNSNIDTCWDAAVAAGAA